MSTSPVPSRLHKHTTVIVASLALLATAGCDGCNGSAAKDAGPKPGADASRPDSGGGQLGLRVSSEDARSCEVLLLDPDLAVTELVFGDGVEGRFLREGTRVSTAFLARADATITAGQVAIEFAAGKTADALVISVARCFDRAGQEIAGAQVTVGQ